MGRTEARACIFARRFARRYFASYASEPASSATLGEHPEAYGAPRQRVVFPSPGASSSVGMPGRARRSASTSACRRSIVSHCAASNRVVASYLARSAAIGASTPASVGMAPRGTRLVPPRGRRNTEMVATKRSTRERQSDPSVATQRIFFLSPAPRNENCPTIAPPTDGLRERLSSGSTAPSRRAVPPPHRSPRYRRRITRARRRAHVFSRLAQARCVLGEARSLPPRSRAFEKDARPWGAACVAPSSTSTRGATIPGRDAGTR